MSLPRPRRWRAALCATLAACLAVTLVTLAAGAPRRPAASFAFAPPPAPAPEPGGVLHYRAYWRLLPAAVATLRWNQVNGQRQISFTADSIGVVSLFYPVRDRMVSNYDPSTFCTTSVDNHKLEGRRQLHTRIRYDPGRHRMVLDETNPAGDPPAVKHVVQTIPGCVLDLFSALDYARSQPLHVGDSYTIPVNEGGKTEQVKLTVDLRETVATPAGSFRTVRAEPTVFGNSVFHRPGRMWIWFTDDARHLPVQVKATVSWGTVLVQLTE